MNVNQSSNIWVFFFSFLFPVQCCGYKPSQQIHHSSILELVCKSMFLRYPFSDFCLFGIEGSFSIVWLLLLLLVCYSFIPNGLPPMCWHLVVYFACSLSLLWWHIMTMISMPLTKLTQNIHQLHDGSGLPVHNACSGHTHSVGNSTPCKSLFFLHIRKFVFWKVVLKSCKCQVIYDASRSVFIHDYLRYACFLFLMISADGTDGKQARRTGMSGPLGELFDHGIDSLATMLMPVGVYSVFGRGEYSLPPDRVYYIILGIIITFIISHWEKYNTGVLYLPWGYDISQIVS